MSTSMDYSAAAAQRDDGYGYGYGPDGAGWVVFAGCMLGLAGTWNLIEGFLAIGRSHVYSTDTTYLFSDLKTWGWIMVFVGALQIVASFGVAAGSGLARWFGIAVASLNGLAQLSFVPSYPLWALSMFALDILVIYALAAHGGKRLADA